MPEYRKVPGHPGHLVSDTGIVLGKTGRRLKTMLRHDALWVRVKTVEGHTIRPVAKLVLLAFVGPPPKGYEKVRYKNGDIFNCNLQNLEYSNHTGRRKKWGEAKQYCFVPIIHPYIASIEARRAAKRRKSNYTLAHNSTGM